MKNTKPFDLQKALNGEEFETTFGLRVKDWKFWKELDFPLRIHVLFEDGKFEHYSIDGKKNMDNTESAYDLCMTPTSRKLYGCYFESDSILEYPCSNLFTTEELREDYISRMKAVINKEVHKFEVEME